MRSSSVSTSSCGASRTSGLEWASGALACLCLLLLVMVAWPAVARATTLQKLSIEQMSRRATAALQGTVVATSVHNSVWGVRTAVRLRVGDALKGPAESYLTVFVPGGVLPDGTRVVVDGMASFRVGDTCFVFVDARGWVIGGFQGKLDVTRGRVLATGESSAAFGRRVRVAIGEAPRAASGRCARRAPPRGAGARRRRPGDHVHHPRRSLRGHAQLRDHRRLRVRRDAGKRRVLVRPQGRRTHQYECHRVVVRHRHQL